MNFHIQHFDTLDSTNKEALRQAENGAHEGLVIVAEQQSAGKGRLGRTWHTIDHALAMTVLLRPDISAMDAPKMALLAAVALHEALVQFAPHIRIKWPNDLLIDGKKVSGILTEMRYHQQHVKALIIGMGINIDAPEHWDKNMRTPPTSLNEHHAYRLRKDDVLQAILAALDGWYARFKDEGFAPVRQAWWAAHVASGKRVSVHDGERYIEGIATGLADNGALRLLVNGQEQLIMAGDVSLLENES